HGARRHAQRGLRQARAGRRENLALHEPSERHDPRAENHRGQGAPAHDSAASPRRSTVSNASRSAGVSTTKETSAVNVALPRWILRIGTMISRSEERRVGKEWRTRWE